MEKWTEARTKTFYPKKQIFQKNSPAISSEQLEAEAWHCNIIWGRVEKVAAAISSEHDKEMNLWPLRFHF